MNLLRNVSELSRGTRLIRSLKRAEEYLFSAKELDGVNGATNSDQLQQQPSVPSFKSLFQEEAKMLPSYLSKLNAASHHPVMGIARDFYGQNPSMPSIAPSLQLRAIFVLLIAKAIGLPPKNGQLTTKELEHMHLIDSKQKALSQITELLFAGHVLHSSVVDISDKGSNTGLHQGNKLATLIGDLIMAKTSRRLSDLKNHIVTEIMSNTICEFSQAGFIGESVTPLPPSEESAEGSDSAKVPQTVHGVRPILTYANWVERSQRGLGAIVGNSCISCMILAGQDDQGVQRFASDLGRSVGTLLQAHRDITIFEHEDGAKTEGIEFVDPWTLPVVLEAERNVGLIPADIRRMDHAKVFEAVQTSQAAMLNCKHVHANLQNQIMNMLGKMEPSEPLAIMLDILASMKMKT